MKRFVVLLSLVLMVSWVFVSCEKEEEVDLPASLKVTAKLPDGNLATNASFSLATSESNRNKGIFVIEDYTPNNQEIIEVLDIDPAKYYYECNSINYGSDNYSVVGTVTLESGQTKELTIVLEKI